jgi:hypothetical protein
LPRATTEAAVPTGPIEFSSEHVILRPHFGCIRADKLMPVDRTADQLVARPSPIPRARYAGHGSSVPIIVKSPILLENLRQWRGSNQHPVTAKTDPGPRHRPDFRVDRGGSDLKAEPNVVRRTYLSPSHPP